MAAYTSYLQGQILNLIFNNTAYSAPSTYVALFSDTASPPASEISTSGTAYARQQITTSSAGWTISGGTASNTATIAFPAATAGYTIQSVAVMDNISGGNMLFYGTLVAPQTLGIGDIFEFTANQLSISIS